MGEIVNIVGKATRKAKHQALSQISTIFDTKPMLKTLIKKDIIHDMRNDIKNENTSL